MSFIDFLFIVFTLGLAILTSFVIVEAWRITQAKRDYHGDLELSSCGQNLCTECNYWFTGCYSRVICRLCVDRGRPHCRGEENGH